MDDAYKDAALAVLEPEEEVQIDLEAPPALEATFIVCPACGCNECEPFTPEADQELSQVGETYVVNCPECSAQFIPPVTESATKRAIIGIYERRMRLRRAIHSSPDTKRQNVAKSEVFRMLSQ
nr:hypothetical protein [uncultured Pseudomonas sp.]